MMTSLSLDEFRAQSRWLCHRDKKPFAPRTGRAQGWAEPSAWADYTTATAKAGNSVGIVVGDGIVAIDLDKAIFLDDSGSPRIKAVFKPLFDLAIERKCYIEKSLSGLGLHIFLKCDWAGEITTRLSKTFAPEQWAEKQGIEIYGGLKPDGSASRFIATTFDTRTCGKAEMISAADDVLQTAIELAQRAKVGAAGHSAISSKGRVPGRGGAESKDAEDKGVADFDRMPDRSPLYVLNRLALLAADVWFPELFPGAIKSGNIWRGTTPGASRDDVSLHPTGVRFWKDDHAKTPLDLVMLFADPCRELSLEDAAAWLAERLLLQAAALKGLATMLARNSHEAPVDIFAELPSSAVPWPKGTLPEALESYAECMGNELGVNDDILSLMFLVTIGAATPASVRLQPDPAKAGWIVPATAWGMLLAPSGAAKSPVLDTALAPIYALEGDWREQHKRALALASPEAKVDLQKRGPKRRVTNGSTAEGLVRLFAGQPQGLILHADELAAVFDFGKYNRGSQSGHSDAAVLLQSYESKSLSIDRKDEARSVAAERAHLSLIGGIQPAVLSGMAESLGANGLLQRALVGVMTISLYGPPCPDVDGRELYHDIVKRILLIGDVEPGEHLLAGSPEVGAAIIENGNRARALALNDPTLSDTTKGFVQKTNGHIARLALWLTLIDWVIANRDGEVLGDDPVPLPSEIGRKALDRAARIWWEYCIPTIRGVYDGSGLSQSVMSDARHIAAYMLARDDKFNKPFTSRVFRDIRTFSGPVGSGRLYAALDLLVERRWLRVIERQTSGAPKYEADDRVWTLFGDRASELHGRWAA